MKQLAGRLAASARVGRLSPRRLFVDPSSSIERAALVIGSARSGTTKLAELVSAGPGVRLILEPLHTFRSPIVPNGFVWGQYQRPGARNDGLQAMLADCLRGRLRNATWLDQYNHARVARHRVVKMIAGTNLTGWCTSTFPDVPVAYLVRHPFAVAHSVAALYEAERDAGRRADWDHQVIAVVDGLVQDAELLDGPLADRAEEIRSVWRDARDPFDRTVLRWCLENHATLSHPPPSVQIVFYERVFSAPRDQLPAIADHLGVPLSPAAYARLDDPSMTDYRREQCAIGERIGDWSWTIEPERVAAGMAILEVFDLQHHYREGVQPVSPLGTGPQA